MAQKKLQRFADIKTFANVLEYPVGMQGKWKDHFKNTNPILLELACGRGEYTVGLARLFPGKNFIGVDVKGNRMYIGAKKCLGEKLSNAAFLRTQITLLPDYFDPGEVHEIWITFPDPQLRTGKAKKRLTHPKFLRLYKEFLTPDGFINLKTDSPHLYHFTKLIIEKYNCTFIKDIDDLYSDENISDELKIKTHYESLDIAKSNRIHYLKFSLPGIFPGIEKDKELQEFLKEYESA